MIRNLLLYTLFFYTKGNIINHNYPLCKNCKYFIPHTDMNYYELSRCKKFGVRNVVTGEIKYNYADLCRDNITKCGLKGVYFVPRNSSTEPPSENVVS